MSPPVRPPPRIGAGLTAAGHLIVKIAEDPVVRRDLGDHTGDGRQVMEQADLVAAIGRFRARYARPLGSGAFRDMADPEALLARHRYLAAQCDPKRLDAVLRYFAAQPQPLVFTSHFGTQYDYRAPDRTDPAHNLVITGFHSERLGDDWNQYALVLRRIPTKRIGLAVYRFTVGGEAVCFTSEAFQAIWSWRRRYWGYAKIFSTAHGRDQAPLLIEISNPRAEDLDNGTYVVIPAEP